MKKILAIAFALVLCLSLSLTAFAGEYTVGSDGNAVYDDAIGYVFSIDYVNGTIVGEDATILTSADGLANCGVWAIWFTAKKIEGTNYYKATTNGAGMGGSAPSVSIGDDEIIVVVHSSSSRPTDAETYPNWEDKVAALAVKKGDCLVLDGINLATGACENGTITVVTEEDINNGNVPETSMPVEESTEAPAESSEVVAESSEAAVESSEAVSEAVSNASPSESTEDSDVNSSTMEIDEEGGLGVWLWVIIGVAVVAIAAALAVVLKKKN